MKLSKRRWQERIINTAKELPKDIRPDDQALLQMLVDVIHAEQSHLRPLNLAMLTGIAAALLDRVQAAMPAATHMTENGERVYTEAEVSTYLGVSLDAVHSIAEEMASQPDGDTLVQTIDADRLRRIN